MGKKGASSWFAAMRKIFRSPSKERSAETTAAQTEDDEVVFSGNSVSLQKKEKSRWFPRSYEVDPPASRFSRRLSKRAREYFAAVFIQAAFRGYLARKALRALRGLVKLQALVRGHNVRKQANATLWCMQALARAQARVKDQRLRLSRGVRDKTSFSCDAHLWTSAMPEKRLSTDARATPVVARNQVLRTPSPGKARLHQVRSASPRYTRPEKPEGSVLPNYMAATESAKARARSQSVPKQRPATPERDRAGASARKRLSFPAPDSRGGGRVAHSQCLRSPSLKSERGRLCSRAVASSCSESMPGEVSPSSTTDLCWMSQRSRDYREVPHEARI